MCASARASSSARLAVRPVFLLVARCHGRPVRRDVRIAQLAVRHARARKQLPVAHKQLVDPVVERHRPLPALAERETLLGSARAVSPASQTARRNSDPRPAARRARARPRSPHPCSPRRTPTRRIACRRARAGKAPPARTSRRPPVGPRTHEARRGGRGCWPGGRSRTTRTARPTSPSSRTGSTPQVLEPRRA